MAASYGYKSGAEAERKAEELRARYWHVEIVEQYYWAYVTEYTVWCCCSRDPEIAEFQRKWGEKCRETLA